MTGQNEASGETPEHCLSREIAEELAIKVTVHHSLAEKTHAYPDFTITLANNNG